MKTSRWFAAAFAAAVFALFPLQSPAHGPRPSDSRDVVIEWNAQLQATQPASAGPGGIRQYAILHVAMFDAINSIDDNYSRFRTRVWASGGASKTAAAAQAAHDVLAALLPASVGAYDTLLAAQLSGISPGRAQQGIAVGKAVAARILAWRADDGWSSPPTSYVLPLLPGLWQPTPPGFAAAALTQYPDVVPFATLSSSQFQARRHPEISSAAYATDFNEVKDIGDVDSTTRTAEQTLLARLFAGVVTSTNAFAMWNNVARDAAASERLSLIDTARLFALVNVSIHDGLQTSQSSKFVYGLWRPVTAIQRAGEDLNDATTADTNWLPLIVTPPYPSYAGNMACIGASAATALALVFDTDAIAFNVTWTGSGGNPNVTRPYGGFWQLAEDQANSRVYAGIHYRFDNLASQEQCPQVAEFAFRTRMLPKRHH